MGQPVVHFEIIGKDGETLWRYYLELFGWEIATDNPMNYGMVAREGNVNTEGVGIGGGIGGYPSSTAGSRSTSRFRMSRPRSQRRRASAARGSWARTRSWIRSSWASSPIPRDT